MKILLVNSDFGNITDVKIMPLTMYVIAGILRRYKHDVKVIDPLLYRFHNSLFSIFDFIKKNNFIYDAIAFTVNSLSWSYTKIEIEKLRDNGYKGKIIIGGLHPKYQYLTLLKDQNIDYILIGEAEQSFPLLLDAIEGKFDFKNIQGLVYKYNGQEKIQPVNGYLDIQNTENSEIAYDLLPNQQYEVMTFESSRGCYGNCTFCSISFKKCWRCYDVNSTVNNMKIAMEVCKNKIKQKAICFTDDCFTTDRFRAKLLLTSFKNLGLTEYQIHLEARLKDLYDPELLSILKEYPKIIIQIGIESGYNEGLKKINKGIQVEDILEISQIIKDNGLNNHVWYSYIVGFPWENIQYCNKTIQNAALIKEKYGISVNCVWWMPVPSELFNEFKQRNPEVDDSFFDIKNWIYNMEIFKKTHPNISENDFQYISKRFKKINKF